MRSSSQWKDLRMGVMCEDLGASLNNSTNKIVLNVVYAHLSDSLSSVG